MLLLFKIFFSYVLFLTKIILKLKINIKDDSSDESVQENSKNTEELAAYKRRLTLVTHEEPLPSDEEEQPDDGSNSVNYFFVTFKYY